MSIASESKRCPRCGEPIPADAPQGLCPKCLLLQASVLTEPGKGEGAKSNLPTREELAVAFPQLEVLELIGQGGMGFVFKARQPKLDRFVALKILPQSLAADPAFAERFTREARILARLSHPNIVAIHDFGQANGYFYLLMEFVEGVNLRQAMKLGRFTPAQALAVVPKICEALQFAHSEGILHRDIKPENILLDSKGRVKIADFGIAKLVGELHADATLTGTGAALGTPHYMAPEQVEHPRDVDQRADIYSLGVVFYEMLTGELPLGRFAPPSEISTVDPRVDAVVLRALEKERERRQQSAGEVKTQVETIVGSASVPPAASGGTKRMAAPVSSAPAFSRTAIAGAFWAPMFLLIFLAVMFWLQPVAVRQPGQLASEPEISWWQWLFRFTLLPLGLAAPFGTTILGWVAVSQIRHSAGRLYGLGLAVFDGLLFPLLALDGLIGGFIYGVVYVVGRFLVPSPGEFLTYRGLMTMIVLCLTVLVPILVGVLIIRRVWRAVNHPLVEGGSSAAEPAARPNRSGGGHWKTTISLVAAGTLALINSAIGS